MPRSEADIGLIYLNDPLNGDPEKEAKIKVEIEKVDARLKTIAEKIRAM